ncbi:MAG: hypothetical protein A2252_11365 [Elusimicrobia bacterium RIFOXYA2_FULL_39_19]|nr:MAG: hypothetical protein A2252_11365 [Elusimicrobia bacterium RIFOXYA2_FULL_39_19]
MNPKIDNFYIQWHLTDRCNLRCLGCYQDNFTNESDLPLSLLKNVANNLFETLAGWNAKLSVMLTGGEPFLKNGLWDLIQYLNTSPLVSDIGIITNGTLIDKHIDNLKNYSKLSKIHISLDGTTQNSNDEIRGSSTFKKVMENIKLLKKHNIPVTVMFTLMKDNLKDAKNLYALLQPLGVEGFIIERFVPIGQGKTIADKVVNAQELYDLYEYYFKMLDVAYVPEEMAKYKAIQIKFGLQDIFTAECIVGRDGMAILPNADVLPCRRFKLPIGNLLTTPLKEIWQSSQVLNEVRNKNNLKGKCRTCAHAECIGCRAMTYSLCGDYLEADPHCWL